MGEPRNKTPIICRRRSIRWPRLHQRKGWCFPSWTSKGTTNKMPLASQTKKQDKMTAFSPYWSETTASYDRAKNFKRVFSERRYSGHLATSRKTVEQGFDKRESLWKRRGGGCGRKGKIFLQKNFLFPPKAFIWWGDYAKGVRSGRKQPPTR